MQQLLTPREHDVVRELLAGRRDKEIAQKLGISPHTLRNHMRELRRKTGADDRLGVALWAIAHDFAATPIPGQPAAAAPPRLDQWLLTGIRAHADEELWTLRRAISAELRDRVNARKNGNEAAAPVLVELDPILRGHLQWTN